MKEGWQIKFSILVLYKISIFSLFVCSFYRKGPALSKGLENDFCWTL